MSTRLKEIENSGADEELKLEAAKRMLSAIVQSFSYETELTELATNLYNTLIESLPSVTEYYSRVKKALNSLALEALKIHEEHAQKLEGLARFRYLVKLSAIGNLIDLGVAGHESVNPLELLPSVVERYEYCVDDTEKFYNLVLKGGRKVLWLFDNAGEAVYDTLLIREIKKLGNAVYGLVKDEPGFQNDVTISDVQYIGLDKLLDHVLTYGCKCSTIHLNKIGSEARKAVEEADLIVSKGMSHYEYLSELELGKPVIFILIPKCVPVAKNISSPECRGKIVVLSR